MPARLIGPRRANGTFWRKRPTVVRPRTRRVAANVAPRVAKAVRKIARAVVRREAETKFVSVTKTANFNSSVSNSSECYPVCPPVPRGDEEYQRVGSKVRPRYLYVKGFVQYDKNYLDTAGFSQYLPPATCRLMILSQRNLGSNGQIPTDVDVNSLLKSNDLASPGPFAYTGSLLDNVTPINKDTFKVHMDRKIKFNWNLHVSYPGGGNSTDAMMAGNDRSKYFTARIKVPSVLHFDKDTGDDPIGFAPFFCFGAVCDDGSTAWTNAPFKVTWVSTLYYDDA